MEVFSMNFIQARVIFTASFLLLLLSSASAAFVVTKIDANANTSYPRQALDPTTGYPSAIYVNSTIGGVHVRTYNGTAWPATKVSPGGGVGSGSDIHIDASGNKYAAIRAGSSLYYGEDTGSGWSVSTPLGSAIWPLINEYGGKKYIAYSSGTAMYIMDCTTSCTTAGNWSLATTVDANSQAGAQYHSAMVIDSSGHPHLFYVAVDGVQYKLKHAAYNGSSWVLSFVDPAGVPNSNYLKQVGAAIDGSNNIYISYSKGGSATTRKLQYGCYNGSSWSLVDLSSVESANIDYGTGIDLDASGEPRIVYYDRDNFKVKIAECNGCVGCGGGSWAVRDVNTTALPAAAQPYPEIDIASNGTIYVTYNGGSVDNAEESQLLPEIPFQFLALVAAIAILITFLVRIGRKKH